MTLEQLRDRVVWLCKIHPLNTECFIDLGYSTFYLEEVDAKKDANLCKDNINIYPKGYPIYKKE